MAAPARGCGLCQEPSHIDSRSPMFRGSKLPVFVSLLIGVAFGYAAASGWLDPGGTAGAKGEPPQPTTAKSAPVPPCCQRGPATVPIGTTVQEGKKPNILMIMGDDIGWFNPSCYHSGIMGYQTPNIDRIAREGARFTDWYGQQSCTAGRAAFVTGQRPVRTGLTKVGLPGADLGLQ